MFSKDARRYRYLSSSCLVAHRTCTEVFFHCSLSAAIILVSSYDLHSASLRFFSTVRCPVVLQSLLRYCLRMWPMIFHLTLHFLAQRCHTRSFQQLLSTDMILSFNRRIFRRHLLWNTFIALSFPLFIFHVSHPYNNNGTTGVLYSLHLVFLEIQLERHLFFNLHLSFFSLTISPCFQASGILSWFHILSSFDVLIFSAEMLRWLLTPQL